MTSAEKILASQEAWESRSLGAHQEFASALAEPPSIDEALELQLISIRLPKTLIDDLKLIADREGMKYQPLVRKLLCRFVDSEMKRIARDTLKEAQDDKRDEEATTDSRIRKVG